MSATTSRTMSDIYTFDSENGTINAVDEDVVENIVRTDISSALGGDVSSDTTTPIGRMIEWLSIHFANVLYVNVQNSNQLVLRAAAGQQLDAIADWFQMERKGAMKTQVMAYLTGAAGSVIPKGSRAQTTAGDIFVSTEDVTLDSDGEGEVVFEAEETGKVYCNKNTLTTIETPTAGWYTITNESDGTLGRDVETDDDLRIRIENDRSTGSGWMSSIKNAIEKIDGVRSSMVLENNTGSALDVHGIPMAPHSVFICIDGLTNDTEMKSAVAKAILDTMSSGTGYTRFDDKTLEVAITSTDSYGNEYPVYVYKPESCNITVDVVVKKRSYTGKDVVSDVKNAILAWAEESTFAIGESVFASDLTRAIEDRVQGIIVVNAMLSDGGVFQQQSFVEIPGNQVAAFYANSITVSEYA